MLGLNQSILMKVSERERGYYKLANSSFYIVMCLVLVADAYLGYFLDGSPLAIILSLVCFGFIHFSLYRLALITLTTKSLSENTKIESFKWNRIFSLLIRSMDGALIFRAVFVGSVSLFVALILTLLCFHNKTTDIQNEHRIFLSQQHAIVSLNSILNERTRFPFFVIQQLWLLRSFKILLIVFYILLQLPLILFGYLRRSINMEYTDLLMKEQRGMVTIAFKIELEESQRLLDSRFPQSFTLSTLFAYKDAPFNTTLKEAMSNELSKSEVSSYLNSF